MSVNHHRFAKYGVSTWNLSVYNVYNHNNPFIVYTDYTWDSEHNVERKVLKQASIFPIIPSISYSFKF